MLKNFLQIHININIKRTTTLNIIIKVITIAKQKNIVKVITLWYDISVKIGGREVSLLRKKKETTAEGIRYLLPDGVLLDCKIEKFAKYGVTRWVNHWYNPGSGSSAQITELCDCDIICNGIMEQVCFLRDITFHIS